MTEIRSDKKDQKGKKGVQKYNFVILIVALIILGVLIIYLKEGKDLHLLFKIAIAIIALIGAFRLGKARNASKDNES